jgi:hypothetical protein
MPDGQQKVMNIVGSPPSPMVVFCHPRDYLFDAVVGEQGGIFNRDIIGIRIEHVDPDKIIAMDKYFQELSERHFHKEAKFNIAFAPIFNLAASILPSSLLGIAERGNCAMYTSKGLREAGVVSRWSMWPKSIWINMFESSRRGPPGNMHVVSYRRVRHAHLRYGTTTSS